MLPNLYPDGERCRCIMTVDNIQIHDTRNQDVERAYKNGCFALSKLRFSVTSKNKVNKTAFNRFKQSFDYLFTLTSNLKALKPHNELTEKILNWLTKRSSVPSIEMANTGIKLFSEYQRALISTELINNN